jgi:aminoglycoside phosphotransferase (APT) family kinase protein
MPEAPASTLVNVRAALRANPRTRPWAELELEPLVGGFNNHSWRLEADGRRYVIRLSGGGDESLGVDRASEAALLTAAAAEGLAPTVVVCDLENRLLITHYVDGDVWTLADARNPRNIVRVAQALTRLHGVEPPAGVRVRSFHEQALRLERVARAKGEAADARLAAKAGKVFGRLDAANVRRTLCHDDLHHLNIIDDGRRLALIDWEYGGLGDPIFDLASFVSYHGLDAAAKAHLLATYAGPADTARLDDARWAFDYAQWLWYLAAAGQPGPMTDEFRVRAGRVRCGLVY